jgi:hypothetical protein
VRSGVLLLCLGALCAGTGNLSAADARTTATKCRFAHTHTLVQNAQARLFRRGDRILGCFYSRGRSTALGERYIEPQSSSGGGGVELLRLAQRFVAVASINIDPNGGQARLDVVDLRSGRRVYRRIPGWGLDVETDITDVVLNHEGSVAYIESVDSRPIGVSPALAVRKHDSDGSALLERGVNVDPTSLMLTGNRLSWSSGGRIRTAILR